MCDHCAPPGGWTRRRFLGVGGGAVLGLGLATGSGDAGAARTDEIVVIPRAEWAGDLAPTGPLVPEPDVRFLLVHHTVHVNDYAADEVVGLLRGMYRYHTGPDKGWPDIAYNFVVDRFGRIWETRAGSIDAAVSGDATGGNQGFDQKCAFMGDHRVAPPSEAAQTAMIALLDHLADRHDVDIAPDATTTFVSRGSNRFPEGTDVRTATITGHRTVSYTECPGDAAMTLVTERFAAAVTARRATTTTTLPTTTTTAPSATSVPESTTSSAPATHGPEDERAAPGGGTPADEPLTWLVTGGALAVGAGALLRLRARRRR